VYAARPFRAGEVVLRWDTSVRLPSTAIAAIPADEQLYVHPLDEAVSFVVQVPERYVNHSCAHNTEVRGFCDVAVRDLAEGEEITSNYETDGAGLSFMCACGEACCRKFIGRGPFESSGR